MMNPMIVAWQSNQFTEEEIVKAFKSTHLDFRRALSCNDLPLPTTQPYSLHLEIYEEHCIAYMEEYNDTDWIAENYGISKSAAYRCTTTKPIHKDLSSAIRERLEQGMRQVDIAKELNITQATVSNNNPKRTKKKRGKGLSEEDWELLKVQLATNKFTISELARYYKVSRPYIYARLQREEESC